MLKGKYSMLVIVLILLLAIDVVAFIRMKNLEERLRYDMDASISSVHERVNQVNEDIVIMNDSICDLETADEEIFARIKEQKNVQRNTNHALSRLRKTFSDFVEASNRQDNDEDAESIGSSSESPQQASYEARDGMEFFGTWDISAYEWTEPQNPCANGNYPTVMYSAACNYLPFGTRIYIEGVGDFVIEDRIGIDNRIDIFLGDVESCRQFGVQTHNVYIYK